MSELVSRVVLYCPQHNVSMPIVIEKSELAREGENCVYSFVSMPHTKVGRSPGENG